MATSLIVDGGTHSSKPNKYRSLPMLLLLLLRLVPWGRMESSGLFGLFYYIDEEEEEENDDEDEEEVALIINQQETS